MKLEMKLPPTVTYDDVARTACPIRRATCICEVCAWWIKESQSCVFVDFAISLRSKAVKVRLE